MRKTARAIIAALLLSPPAAFAGHFWSDADVAAIRSRASQPEYRKELDATRRSADLLAKLPDDEIWSIVPDPNLPRAINVRFGLDCPIHGAEIFKHGGHYPWIMSPGKPYQLECPVGHEIYPSNDYAAYLRAGRKEKLDTRQKYVDDGYGWTGGPEGKPYFFVGYYAFWQIWRKTICEGVDACGKIYLATGEEVYAHKAAVCLARLSQVYPRLDWSTQGVSDGKYPSEWTGRINDRIWENGALAGFARAYDAISSTFPTDASLQHLASSHNLPDVDAAIRRDVLGVGASDIMAGKIHGNKFELGALSSIALALHNDDPAKGPTTRQMVDWILTGGGELEFTFYNGFDRDGIGGESSPAYSSYWNDRFVETAFNLSRLGLDISRDRKWLRIAKGPSELRILDQLTPRIGDTGGGLLGERLVHNPALLRFGLEHFNDPDCAAWLLRSSADSPDTAATTRVSPLTTGQLFARDSVPLDRVRSLASSSTFPPAPFTRDLGGYGLAILELNDGASKRSATLYYGGPETAHQHRDRLNLGYYVDSREILTEMGYPSHWGPDASFWTQNTPSHYCVTIDQQAQSSLAAGHLTAFADLPGLKLASADALSAWQPPRPPYSQPPSTSPSDQRPTPTPIHAYQRTLALLDTGEKSSLLIDAFLVQGGATHDYSFHGLPYAQLHLNLPPTRKQTTGTLAGESIAYAQDPGAGRKFGGYQYLMRPTWYAPPPDTAHLTWSNDAGYTQHTWFPRISFDELIVADTTPPIKPGFPRTIPYILLRHTTRSPDTTSLFLSITDASKRPTPVEAVLPIKSSSDHAAGVLIRLRSGTEWRLYINESSAPATFDDGATSSLRFVAIQSQSETPTLAHAVGPGSFSRPGLPTLTLPAANLKVRSVDYPTSTVTLDGDPPAPGSVLLALSGPNSQSYTVRSSTGRTLCFGDTPLLTGRFLCAYDPSLHKLLARERTRGYYNQFAGKSFIGMTAVSEDLSTTAAITSYDPDANTFTLDAPPAVAARFTDSNGDGRPYVYIADIAPGVTLSPTPARTFTFDTPHQEHHP